MTEESPTHLDLAKEISEMASEDQEMRKRVISGEVLDKSLDKKHIQRMKEIIDTIGWPGKSKVGDISSQQAWLLVQHADQDITFQEECLELMKPLGDDVKPEYVAFLEDRIRVNRGKPQLYGTQFFRSDEGIMKPQPIEEPNSLDERRSKVGLESFKKYADRFNDPNNPWVKK